ncbi:type II secretion system F family protein [Nocardioides marinquilinus]|uniref:Type II secretion system F family protein n=1 Tax=Nocardioides marinquilinus TaxID=1210400 RepID=A0ABP9PZY8_9ACTN
MTPAWWGALAGGAAGLGVVLVVVRVLTIRRPSLALRVLPYVRDVPQLGAGPRLATPSASTSAASGVFGPLLRSAADAVERLLGGAPSVQRRLARAGLDRTVHDFRVEQVVWGLVGFAAAASLGLLQALASRANPVGLLVLALVAFVSGVLARDTWLTSQVRSRERQIMAEFPTVAELLALAVAAGEGPVGALDRVVARSGGALSDDLAAVLADIRTGEPVGAAFDRMAAASGLPLVSRFAQGVAIAVDRGTPLADVLHAQAGDVREAGRRELIELGARREVLMMVPVVFLVLPVTVLFAFYPGVIGLSLSAT